MDIKNRIEVAKINLRRAENAKVQAETQKAAAEKQLAEVIEQMAAEGVTPDTIQQEIAKLENQVETDLGRVEALIPQV
ncbi:hypothetical protein [Brevibacillus fulvus]|uniref:Uncharacterized protein YfcZ (UPF0381/DUF406 family) n=1 Tax=Brevibacillus fulvus TaxID=1125967 RepID=A0A938XZP6_9BACL|nr:hypothetical protein [Brevibacillus fulvus]MBM7591204.1 uncharacterized protein YfcZ (UPF0381/DUF406 family) [Brevibacillus fulvus]